MENPESLFRRRSGKEKASTSQTKRSLFQEEFYSFQELYLGVNVRKSLLRSKSKLDLKQTEINPNRFESYLLDFLWHNLQNTVKSEGSNSPLHTFQPEPTSSNHNPPHIPPVVQSPPKPMAARFAPLAFPVVLNYLS